MEIDFNYNAPGATPTGVTAPTQVDARVYGGLMTLCEFAGNCLSPDKKRQCKHFQDATHANRCMYFRSEIDGGHCDKGKETSDEPNTT